ncbi:MAG: aminotransferase class V-fold PLP-dependent enzyme [Rheinheimera sp.]|nr:aminotransferase class V-fold PLP-dependent enzyme [Rheinheimera sp.]
MAPVADKLYLPLAQLKVSKPQLFPALSDAKRRGLGGPETLLLYGATEHKAVPESLKHWNAVLQLNATVQAIPVDQHGILDLKALELLLPKAAMVCTMAANNETGVKQDLLALEQLIRRVNKDVRWMVDCVQALRQNVVRYRQY